MIIMHMPFFSSLFVLFYFNSVSSIPIDNGVEGEPEIECGPTSLTINFNTRNTFEGHVYVKGLYDRDECRSDSGGRQVAGIEVQMDSCNVERSRSLNPRGVFVSTIIVISFHPKFITKIDRAYRIQCFYMEADKTVSAELEVSEMTTAFQTQVVPMPVCRYEILEGGPTGTPIRYAMIGDHVYHKWTCDSETTDIFCALVHSCTVDDGKGDTVEILNEEGCAVDKYLLNNLEYLSDLMAGQEAHVYKYADRSEIYYQCQISITIKEPFGECPRPQCPEPQGFGAIKSAAAQAPEAALLSPRLLKKRSVNYDNTVDVSAGFSAIEISEQNPNLSANRLLQTAGRQSIIALNDQNRGIFCIASHDILLIILFGAMLAIGSILFTVFIIHRIKS
uniref:ZP domain-containing protein n=1 Tax=Onchocerca volvulus TaxID=6282 RepID=A0A8R1XNS9_ONCVO